jgi:hypothetical protein
LLFSLPSAAPHKFLGGDDDWGFAIYDPATEIYTDAVLRTGDYAGNPTAFGTAITHLAEYQQ